MEPLIAGGILDQKRNEQIQRMRVLLSEHGTSGWEAAWQEQTTPWDSGHVQAPLREFVNSEVGKSLLSKLPPNARVLVPGCGTGYDAAYFASLGYNTIGADLSETAVKRATEWSQASADADALSRLSYRQLDFFTFDTEGGFDLVYDYTFFVAFPLNMREAWGRAMRRVVKPGGLLVTLVWPIDGDRPGGPPFTTSVEAISKALSEGDGPLEAHWTKVLDIVPETSEESHVGRERLAVWERTAKPSEGNP